MAKRNKALANWLKAQPPPRHTQTNFAKRLGVTVSTVHDILEGRRAPSLALALKIEALTKLPPRVFEEAVL
jgi:transcriptional regulator with XRE-family HTH domain